MKPNLLKNKWFLAFVITTVVAVAAIVVAIVIGTTSNASGPDEPDLPDQYVEGDEVGVYYYDVVDGEVLLTLSGGNKFTLTGPTINKTGTYTVGEAGITLDFIKDEDGTATATINGDSISLVYNNTTMSFLKKVNYTVSFNVNGGNEISALKVVNGKTVIRPADPTKENSVFLGWYADEAFATPFDFDTTTVKADLTVYAKWAEKTAGVADYTVKFDLGYEGAETLDDIVTVSGIAYGVTTPEREGYTFGGWWISMYDDGTKLSYEFKADTVFTADTTLFAVWHENSSTKLAAPAVTLTNNTISWNSVKDAASYKLTVIDPAGNAVINNETVGTTTKAFDFAAGTPGEYKVSVVAVASNEENNSEASERYYANKTLDRVSNFFVENGILVFGAVENAQKYTITIDCGTEGHVHSAFDNGSSTTYYIGNCAMKQGGILITVTASANGYASSVSKQFAYDKSLAQIENLVYDNANDKFVWDAVNGTMAYYVTVKVGNEEYTFNNSTNTSFSVAGFTGDISVSVVPVTEGYNSPAAATASCKKTVPAAPNGLAAAGNVISWNAVAGATSYEVKIGTNTVNVTTNQLTLSDASITLTQGQIYSVKVKAINVNNESSAYSNEISVGYFAMDSNLTYSQNTVYWSPVLGANQYQVRVNGGEPILVTDVTSAKVTLTKEGENLIEVRYVYGETVSEWVSVTVNAFAVEYDTRSLTGGLYLVEYLAIGDVMTLPETGFAYDGYDFAGWYNAPKGSSGNGKFYANGSVFSGNAYTVVYANWSPKTYNVTLRVDGFGFDVTNIVDGAKEPVTYTKLFQLPVPTAQSTGMYFFAGWYTGTSGTGIKITDENGNAVVPYEYTRDITLYPYYSTNALSFTLQDDGTYAVAKGDTIKSVTNLKIPVTYNEIAVTVILENAFSGCTTLTNIEIPDTIRLVGTGAFNGCSILESIKVYVAKPEEAGKYETIYRDDNGVLIREDMGVTWLEFVPRAMTGEYTIPSDVEMILPKAFYNSKITKVIIPKTINDLPEYAFYGCTSLEEITFEGGRTEPISFNKKSFHFPSYNSKVKTINLPALISSDIDFATLKGVLAYMYELNAINVEEGGTVFASVGGLLTDAEKHTILYCPRGYAGDLTIPQGITTIGASAFQYCDLVTSLTIPVWVTNVEKGAFQYNYGITSITFKGSRSENLNIAESAFSCVYNVETITFEGNGTNELDAGQIIMDRLAFYGSSYSSVLHTVTIGDGVNIKSISNQAFQTQGKLREFNISEKAYIGSIGEKAFEKCVSLTGFTVPVTVTEIAANAFNGCTKLSQLNFATAEGESALTIKSTAFNGCTALKSLELPDRLTAFEASAFEGCTGLKAITVKSTNKNYVTDSNGILYAKNLDENNNVVFTELLFYPKALVVENGGVIDNLPDTLVTIGGSAFSDNAALKIVVIPAKVTSIGDYAFANCEALISIQFKAATAVDDAEPMTLTIGNSAFINCKSLTDDFRLPDYTTTIGVASFQGCEFTKFVIPEGVTFIGKAAFFGLEKLEHVEFKCTGELVIENSTNNTVTAGGAFANCTALTRVDLPVGLTELGGYAFYQCYALETVNIGNVTVKDGVYSVESKLTRIGNRAFEKCSAMQMIVIPKSVTAIGTNAFGGASATPGSLTTVIFEKGGTEPLNIASGSFQYQTSLVSITLPERALLPTSTSLPKKDGSTTLKDANGNNLYLAPTADIATNVQVNLTKQVFTGCTALAEVNIEEDEAITGLFTTVDGVIYNADKTVLIFCPYANVGTYKNGEPTYELIVPNTVKLVVTYAINDCTALKTITFEEFDKSDERYGTQLLTIGNYTNSSASATSYIAIGGKTSSITKVNLPSHLKELSFNAFCCGSSTATVIEELEPMEIIFNPDAKNVVIEKYAFYYSTVKALALPGIKSIGDYAFANCHKLESFSFSTLDSTLKKFPNYMLQNAKKLTSFVIPAQITEIGTYVFSGCGSLSDIVIPETVTKLGNYSFSNSGITTLTIHSKFTNTNLGTYLFSNCVNLTTVHFASKADGSYPLTQIPDNMFDGCTSLATVNIEDFADKITKIGKGAFNKTIVSAFDFTKFTALKTVGTTSFSYNPNYTSIDLTKTKLTAISTAFNNLPNLEEIKLPESMTTNFTSASFTNDVKLAKVVLPKSFNSSWIANLNSYVVQKSNVPVEIVFHPEMKNISIDEFGVVYCPEKQTIYFVSPSADLSEYTIPETVITIDKYAFAYNESLKTLVIPEGVTEIRASAFEHSGVTHVVIPTTVTIIDDYAFGYTPLEEFIFIDTIETPSQLTTLGSAVFRYSTIPSIVFPDKLTTIENNLFTYCSNLKSITTGASMTEIPNGLASHVNSLEEIIMQEGIETIRWIFSSYSYNGRYGINKVTSLHIPASVKLIVSDAFCDFGNLKTITFAEGSALETIEKHAFENCVSLEEVNGLPASLAAIGEKAFYNCPSLKALDLSATAVTEIAQYAFYNTKSMASFALPAALTTIGDYAFFGSGIENLNISATVNAIGLSAFENSALKTVVFSNASTMTSLGELTVSGKDVNANIFKGTYQLETVVLPNFLKTIARGVFANSAVKSVVMADQNNPSSLEYIGDSAFENCENLTGFAHLEQVTEIGEKAFFLCSNLENTTVSDSLTSLGAMAFAFCNKLTEGYYPTSLTTLGGNAYGGLDASKIKLSEKNKNFALNTDANGVITLTDAEETVIYAVYGATGAYAFSEVTYVTYAPGALAGNAITEVVVPAKLGVVPDYMFMGCNTLASVTIADELTEIGQYAFYNTALATITIPATVTTIGDYAFAYNANINNVVIPKTTTEMGNYVFAYCQTLSNFDFESFAEDETSKTQTIGTHFFYNCPNITQVILPDRINTTDEDKAAHSASYKTAIPSYMFAGTGIVNAVIPENDANLYLFTSGVFANCKDLVSVYFEDYYAYSGSYGSANPSFFDGCDKLENIYINSIDKAGYIIGMMANGGFSTGVHIKNSVKDETTEPLNSTAYLDDVTNEDFEVYFDADGYADIVEYFAGVRDAWNFKVYDKDGNQLHCSEENGSIAYVTDANGNVIWGEKPAA